MQRIKVDGKGFFNSSGKLRLEVLYKFCYTSRSIVIMAIGDEDVVPACGRQGRSEGIG